MQPVCAILDFPGSSRAVYRDPVRIISCHHLDDVRSALRETDSAARAGLAAIGFVAYEAATAFDAALVTAPPDPGLPLLWFALFDLSPLAAETPSRTGPVQSLEWQADTSPAQFDAAIRMIREGIAAGDFYQVNYALRLHARCGHDPGELYDALVAGRHGLYHMLIETPEWVILSASPELFIDIRGGIVTARPMKGTMRRGRWLEEDGAAAAALAASEKDRAENLMIVDLLRNDLGRVAKFGSVHVPRLFDIESYPTVHQMTSTVTAELRVDATLDDIFAAAFPCGSVTGAPKVTAMRAIAGLEQAPRGAYCGAIGIVTPDAATFNVGIRTLTIDRMRNRATYGAGAGITWDSRADAEYDEVVAKAALLDEQLPAFELLETMRLHDGTYARLHLHLARLRDSAAYWGFPHDVADNAARALDEEARTAGAGTWRVRLTAARDGSIGITRAPIEKPRADVRTIALALTPVSSRDRLLFHKTTARATYDMHRSEQPDAFDVLLFNEHGHVTEFTTGNIIIERDGIMITPARACGLLAGTFRAQLLHEARVREALVTVDDVRAATRVWFVNSVREWVEVRLDEERAESQRTLPL
jgi:para-aminobenzoate synthetase/4-amino-4-deoxychorismate lyase